jgi:hypothetical protein
LISSNKNEMIIIYGLGRTGVESGSGMDALFYRKFAGTELIMITWLPNNKIDGDCFVEKTFYKKLLGLMYLSVLMHYGL